MCPSLPTPQISSVFGPLCIKWTSRDMTWNSNSSDQARGKMTCSFLQVQYSFCDRRGSHLLKLIVAHIGQATIGHKPYCDSIPSSLSLTILFHSNTYTWMIHMNDLFKYTKHKEQYVWSTTLQRLTIHYQLWWNVYDIWLGIINHAPTIFIIFRYYTICPHSESLEWKQRGTQHAVCVYVCQHLVNTPRVHATCEVSHVKNPQVMALTSLYQK